MKAAVIGAGFIAREHLSALRDVEGVEVVGVCDLSRVMAESTSELMGAGRWYTEHRTMLAETRPDVVHITTPPGSHVSLACDAIESGAHVFVEKPMAPTAEGMARIKETAAKHGKMVVEDHNYLFNDPVQELLGLVRSGELGEVVHVDTRFFLNIHDKASRYGDPNAPHPCLKLPGGAISDFLSHMAYLTHAFIGRHKLVRAMWRKRAAEALVPSDEMRALIEGERGTGLIFFSSHAEPTNFVMQVHGTKMRATVSLWEPLLGLERTRETSSPMQFMLNNLSLAAAYQKSGLGGLWKKLSGRPALYKGLGELLRRFYRSLETGAPPPITLETIQAVHDLVEALTAAENAF